MHSPGYLTADIRKRGEEGTARVNAMNNRLIHVLVDAAALQDTPSIAALPETQAARSAVAEVVSAASK